ncbi:MAG: hypothetical protein VXY07_04885, partial [Planctomycetota bacterium]|nr:hypothetical protein [Planctomycetota bacterium]
ETSAQASCPESTIWIQCDGSFGPGWHIELSRIKSIRIDLTDRFPFSRPHSKACPGRSLPWVFRVETRFLQFPEYGPTPAHPFIR